MIKFKKFWKVFRWFVLAGFIFSIVVHGALVIFVNNSSDGKVTSGGNEISVNIETYSKGRENVVLIPMCHVAEPGFYESVTARIEASDLVLTEGVNDTQGVLIGENFSYKPVADIFGLVEQPRFTGANIVNADGDLADLSSETQEVIKLITRFLANLDNLAAAMEFADKNKDVLEDEEIMKRVMKELIESRNLVLLQSLTSVHEGTPYLAERIAAIGQSYSVEDNESLMKLSPEDQEIYKEKRREVAELWLQMARGVEAFANIKESQKRTVCLPWGAKHIKGLEEHLKAKGFSKTSSEKLRLTSLFHLYLSLLKNIF